MTGEELRKRRIKLKLNQDEFGALIGISRNTVSNYERNKKIPASRMPALLSALERLENEIVSENQSKNQEKLQSLVKETESGHLLEAVLEKFHPLEVIRYIHNHFDQYLEYEEFFMLARNVVNMDEIAQMRKDIEELNEKFRQIEKSKER